MLGALSTTTTCQVKRKLFWAERCIRIYENGLEYGDVLKPDCVRQSLHFETVVLSPMRNYGLEFALRSERDGTSIDFKFEKEEEASRVYSVLEANTRQSRVSSPHGEASSVPPASRQSLSACQTHTEYIAPFEISELTARIVACVCFVALILPVSAILNCALLSGFTCYYMHHLRKTLDGKDSFNGKESLMTLGSAEKARKGD